MTDAEAEPYRANLARFEASSDYLIDNWDRLLGLYPEQWVAVNGDGVVGHGFDYDAVLAEVRRLSDDPGSLDIQFLSRHREMWTLGIG
jgi:hypothetical protein